MLAWRFTQGMLLAGLIVGSAQATPVTAVFGDQAGTLWAPAAPTAVTDRSTIVIGFQVGTGASAKRYSTGANDSLMPTVPAFTPAQFQALAPDSILTPTSGSPLIGKGTAFPIDPKPPTPPPLAPLITDGVQGLELATAVFNLPAQTLRFRVGLPASPDLTTPAMLVTQVGDTSKPDVYQFVNSVGTVVGHPVSIIVSPTGIARINWQFYRVDGSNAAHAPGTITGVGPRAVRLASFTLADFGITAANAGTVASFEQSLSGESDVAFVAYNKGLVMVHGPDMAIDLSGLTNAPLVQAQSYYGTFTCQNRGTGGASAAAMPATNCTVSTLPAGLAVSGCSIDTAAPPPPWTAGQTLPAGATVTCAVSGTPTALGTTAVNGSTSGANLTTINGTPVTTPDTDPSNNSAMLALTVSAAPLADMRVDSVNLPAGTVGQPYNGSFACGNHGAGAASAGTCAPAGLPSWATADCTPKPPAALASGAVINCTVTGTPDAKGSSSVIVRTSAAQESDTTNNEGSATLVIGGTPNVMIDLSGLPTTGTVNQPYTGHFSCTNQGTADATGTVCNATLAPWMALGACTLSPSSSAWTSPSDIPGGQTVTCQVTGTPTQTGPSTINGTGGTNTATTTVTVAGAALPVPTLGQWALMLLAGLLAAFGLHRSSRRAH
ncbi:IPTL-CTERM sorting domain-containing protein [Ottowia sp. GY511]|uniref:IPTL-CTERM sorting domain-containing protein n=1 Tax=Ottowia flava TaxID=2675430 RepID=A0ABW4KQZ9_9BURK|nr:IPTL-CTERM sorting domain-containing protein [Ottowia sp. GY511]TXK33007.1 IPTL-CTERM sorting domain-containing protein [Ottowia sp. GY511]